MEKLIRTLMIGFVLATGTLISLGWKAYAEINSIRKEVKQEIKEEMIEVRNRDMEYLNNRFNTIEILVSGRIVTRDPIPKIEENGK
jgi:hypothetical protein